MITSKKTPRKFSKAEIAKDPKVLIGKLVLKDFFDSELGRVRPFEGKVTNYFPKEQWYNVKYEDGDSEDLELPDLMKLIDRADADIARLLSCSLTAPQSKSKSLKKVTKSNPADSKTPSKTTTKVLEPDSKKKVVKSASKATSPASIPKKKATPKKSEALQTTPVDKKRRVEKGQDYKEDSESDWESDDEEEYFLDQEVTIPKAKPSARKIVAPTDTKTCTPKEKYKGKSKSPAGSSKAKPSPAAASPLAATAGAGVSPASGGVEKKKVYAKNKPKTPAKLHKDKAEKVREHNEAQLKEVSQRVRYDWETGKEPWRSLQHFDVDVNEQPLLDVDSKKKIQLCKKHFYREYRKAEEEETARVEGTVDHLGRKGFDNNGTRLSRRPDRVTESRMKGEGLAIHQERRVGHVPGVPIDHRCYGRSELSCIGMHRPPVAGIDRVSTRPEVGIPGFAVSIVCSGWYQDNGDNGQELIYTGEGGNDLLGKRTQVADQKLERGNLALVGNIQLGLPVRVVRKNSHGDGLYGCVLVYDGLYDVVEYWRTKGKENTYVYQFSLVRRPGQGPLLTNTVKWGGFSAPKDYTPLKRHGVLDLDISGGKEEIPIPAINDCLDDELPPCTDLARVPKEETLQYSNIIAERGISEKKLKELIKAKYEPPVQYVTEYQYADGIAPPPAPVLPPQYENNPHEYIQELNKGRLPYIVAKKGLVQLREAMPVVYECGPWCGCVDGPACPQAVSQRGIRYRLEVYKTSDGRGWGLRTMDLIPQFSYICTYFGDVYRSADYDRMVEQDHHDGAYSMDMAVRPDRDWEGNIVATATSSADMAEYVICGLHRRNVAAFMNHSCTPNCFVQPLLSDHHDLAMPKIAIFAGEDIAPLTQLTWDYGQDYVSMKFDDGCKCGSEECISRHVAGGRDGDTGGGLTRWG